MGGMLQQVFFLTTNANYRTTNNPVLPSLSLIYPSYSIGSPLSQGGELPLVLFGRCSPEGSGRSPAPRHRDVHKA